MNRAHLHVAVDNTSASARKERAERAGREAAYRDFEVLAERAEYWRAMAIMILMTPINFVLWMARTAYSTGRGVIVGTVRLIVGTIGVVFIVIVAFGMLHVLLHPLFN